MRKRIAITSLAFILALTSVMTLNGDGIQVADAASGDLDARAVWLHPNLSLTSSDKVEPLVDKLDQAGVQIVFLAVNSTAGETYYPGSALFPTADPFKAWDPIRAFLNAAHAKGIEVHAYVHLLNNPYLAQQYPHLAAVNRVNPDKETLSWLFPESLMPSYNKPRGIDEIVIYLPGYGLRTGTNDFGTEVIVQNGVVQSVSVQSGNNYIPSDGYVISGHGSGARWLMNHFYPGMAITGEIVPQRKVSDRWLEPAEPKVRQILIQWTHELMSRYNFDGYHLDHIRYTWTAEGEKTLFNYSLYNGPKVWTEELYGYSDINRQTFQAKYGVDPFFLNAQKQPQLFQEWLELREENITELVRQLAETARSYNDRIVISAALANREAYDDWFSQFSGVDYRKLARHLDIVIPMAYYVEQGESAKLYPHNPAEWVGLVTRGAKERIGKQALLYTGIGLATRNMDKMNHNDWLQTVHIAKQNGADGVVIFDWYNATYGEKDYRAIESIRERAWHTPADIPHRDAVTMYLVRAYSNPPFTDIRPGYQFEDAIYMLVAMGMMNGYGDGRFGPDDPMTRAQAAVILSNALGLAATPANYPDVKPDFWANGAIGAMQRAGIMSGDGSGFHPGRYLTRAQMAKMLVLAFDIQPGPYTYTFPDVQPDDWYYPYVQIAASNQIFGGYADGTFGPNDRLTRGQATSMLYKALQWAQQSQTE